MFAGTLVFLFILSWTNGFQLGIIVSHKHFHLVAGIPISSSSVSPPTKGFFLVRLLQGAAVLGGAAAAAGGGAAAPAPNQLDSTAVAAIRDPSEESPGGTGRTPTTPWRRSSSRFGRWSDGVATTSHRSDQPVGGVSSSRPYHEDSSYRHRLVHPLIIPIHNTHLLAIFNTWYGITCCGRLWT